MNSTDELLSGLSNIPLFLCGIGMCTAALRSGGKGAVRKNWIIISVLLCFTLLTGVFVHTVKLSSELLRVLWPFIFLLITELVRRFWLQMIRIFKGPETERKVRIPVTIFAFVTAAVNGLLGYFKGADLAPLFLIFSVPASLHIIWMAATDRDARNAGFRRTVAGGMIFMFASTLADGMIRKPVNILGVPCTGALFGHLLMLAALLMLIRMISLSSREEDIET
jgi:hypothetical protein